MIAVFFFFLKHSKSIIKDILNYFFLIFPILSSKAFIFIFDLKWLWDNNKATYEVVPPSQRLQQLKLKSPYLTFEDPQGRQDSCN
jgi:hypothetical protein